MRNEVKLANPNYDSSKIEEFKNVWVFCEQRQGQMMSTSYELISEGRKLADELGVKLCGLLVGDNVGDLAESIGGYGADEVIVCDHPLLKNYTTDAYSKVICDVISEMKPEAFLIGATNIGRDLGPRCAARLHTGLCADCTHLDVDMPIYKDFLRGASTLPEAKIDGMATAKVMGQDHDVSRDLKMTRPAFGGNLMATIICPKTRPQMSTVRPGVMQKQERQAGATGEIINVKPNLTAADIRIDIKDIVKSAKEMVSLTDADIICSGGRGLGDASGFELIKQFADKVGGVVGSSRAAVDAGRIAHSHQVGQTGTTVKPKIYFACGISGAIQHLAGMQNSDCIVAINKDADAPIMEIADYAIVGDLYKVIPEIIKEWDNAEALYDATTK